MNFDLFACDRAAVAPSFCCQPDAPKAGAPWVDPAGIPSLPLYRQQWATRLKDAAGFLLAGSLGSGLCYWPERGTLLNLDNSGRIIETDLDGAYVRTITLSGFGDVEGIAWMGDRRFVIGAEHHGSGVDRLIVIDLPQSGNATVALSAAVWVLDPVLATADNRGIEGVAWEAATPDFPRGRFLFVTEKPQTVGSPAYWWVAWSELPEGSPTGATPQTVDVLKMFSIQDVAGELAGDVSDLHLTSRGTILILSQEGRGLGRSSLLEVTKSGERLQWIDGPEALVQAEGVTLAPSATDLDGLLFITGEDAAGCPLVKLQY